MAQKMFLGTFCFLTLTALLSRHAATSASELVARSSLGDAVRVWWDKGGLSRHDFSCYEPSRTSPQWYVLGQRAQGNHDALTEPIFAFKEKTAGTALKMPLGFKMVWDDRGSLMDEDGSVWRLTCPTGFVALGDFFYAGNWLDSPGPDLYYKSACVRQDLTETCEMVTPRIWDDGGAVAWNDVSVWVSLASSNGLGGFFYANSVHELPPSVTFYCLKKSSFEEEKK